MRIVVVVLVAVMARGAFAGCPPGEKRFQCHQAALRAQLAGDLATARALYRDACDHGCVPSASR